MKKKGFTLVELLAVIAILAILVIIALPNVMSMFNNARKNSFSTEAARIMQVAQQQSISDSIMASGLHCYARINTTEGDTKTGITDTGAGTCPELDLSGRKELRYVILFDKAGEVTDYVATDGTYYLNYHGAGLQIEEVKSSPAGSKIPASVSGSTVTYTSSPQTFALTDGDALDSSNTNHKDSYSKATISVSYASNKYTATITPGN